MVNAKRIFGCLVLAAGLIVAAGVQAADASRVWVVFKAGQKASVKAQVEASKGRIHYEFDDLRAIAATLPNAALAGVRANPGVEYVEEDPRRYLLAQTVPYGVEMVQAAGTGGAWAAGATGSGIKVGVIDSGVHAAHEDFAGVALSGDNDSGSGTWNTDKCGHGTHVVGTIAAVNNTVGVVGVSPQAQIYMVKVFGDDCGWAYSSSLVSAANKAQSAGARIISMSLGGSLRSKTENQAFDSLYQKNVLSIAAAGNDGSTRNSYPASYGSVVSVAAVDQNTVVADFSQKNSQVELAAPGVGVLSTVSYLPSSVTVSGTAYGGENIEGSARTDVSGTLVAGGLCGNGSVGWQDKVVLCERGTYSFAEKVAAVQGVGGKAAVIYNNVAGGFAGTLGGTTSAIPAISISQADGQSLFAATTSTNTASVVNSGATGSGYAYYDGTSMATPHVSAVAALVWSKYPCATNAQVRAALGDSAKDLGPSGRDTSYGYGLVQANDALTRLSNAVGGSCQTPPPPPPSGGSDTTPPVISNVKAVVTNAKNGSFKITWGTEEPATSDVTINGIDYNDANLVTSHSRSFRGTKGVLYTYTVRSTDAAGNEATSGPFTFQN